MTTCLQLGGVVLVTWLFLSACLGTWLEWRSRR